MNIITIVIDLSDSNVFSLTVSNIHYKILLKQ